MPNPSLNIDQHTAMVIYEEGSRRFLDNIVQHMACRSVPWQMHEAINALRHLYVGLGLVESFEEINSGLCEHFAKHVTKIVPEATLDWDDSHDEHSPKQLFVVGHCVVIYQDRFYDAEAPFGRDKQHELPIYIRINGPTGLKSEPLSVDPKGVLQ